MAVVREQSTQQTIRVALAVAVAVLAVAAASTGANASGRGHSPSAAIADRVDTATPEDPLDHPLRRQLYERIREQPGTYPAALVDATGEPRSTVRYHLRVLVDAGLVRAVERTGKRHLVPASFSDQEAELAIARTDAATAEILDALAVGGPLSVSTLAERLDRSPSTVSHHLSRLADRGLVERTRRGHAAVNALPDWVSRAAKRSVDAAADRG